MKKPELLAPAGTLENAEFAFRYGADAVYLGLQGFSLRSGRKAEMDAAQFTETVALAKAIQKKVYVALNTFPHDTDLDQLEDVVALLKETRPDALIVADPGIIRLVREHLAGLELHLSTQANTLNVAAVKFWQEQGIRRMILARELTREEILRIREGAPDVELEMFVHGAMCMAISGRCHLSQYFLGRDANRGECAMPCRWEYSLEATGASNHFEMEENAQGTYILNSQDLNLASFIPDLMTIGIDSVKIEGRNKTSSYIANTCRVYRKIIDSTLENGGQYTPSEDLLKELEKVSHRPFSTGFFGGNRGPLRLDSSAYIKTGKMVALAISDPATPGMLNLDVRDGIKVGDELEILKPDPAMDRKFKLPEMTNLINGESLQSAHNLYRVSLPFDEVIDAPLIVRKSNI